MELFNEKGLLNPGFSEYKLEEIEKIFVKEFSESQTRSNIYNGFLIWLKHLLNILKFGLMTRLLSTKCFIYCKNVIFIKN